MKETENINRKDEDNTIENEQFNKEERGGKRLFSNLKRKFKFVEVTIDHSSKPAQPGMSKRLSPKDLLFIAITVSTPLYLFVFYAITYAYETLYSRIYNSYALPLFSSRYLISVLEFIFILITPVLLGYLIMYYAKRRVLSFSNAGVIYGLITTFVVVRRVLFGTVLPNDPLFGNGFTFLNFLFQGMIFGLIFFANLVSLSILRPLYKKFKLLVFIMMIGAILGAIVLAGLFYLFGIDPFIVEIAASLFLILCFVLHEAYLKRAGTIIEGAFEGKFTFILEYFPIYMLNFVFFSIVPSYFILQNLSEFSVFYLSPLWQMFLIIASAGLLVSIIMYLSKLRFASNTDIYLIAIFSFIVGLLQGHFFPILRTNISTLFTGLAIILNWITFMTMVARDNKKLNHHIVIVVFLFVLSILFGFLINNMRVIIGAKLITGNSDLSTLSGYGEDLIQQIENLRFYVVLGISTLGLIGAIINEVRIRKPKKAAISTTNISEPIESKKPDTNTQ